VKDICDICHGVLVQRADDNSTAVQERLADYHNKTEPLLELFGRKRVIVKVNGTGPATEVYANLRRQLGLAGEKQVLLA
jgi:adenylate kinase